MKYLIFSISLLFIAISPASAQSETKSFDVGGIKVIFKPSEKNIINVRMYYRGGVSNYPASKAGIENLTLDAATKCGTKKYSAEAMRDSSDKYDILMNGASTYDYGYIQINSIPKYFNQAWDMFTEAVVDPLFEPAALELMKSKKITIAKDALSTPYPGLNELQMRNAFANTPYAINPNGDEGTISKFTSTDLKSYYSGLLNKNRIFIVVVGKITKEDLVEKIIASFGNIAMLPYLPPDYTPPVWNNSRLVSQPRELATNYVSAIMNSPGLTSIDYVPFRLGISGLSGNIIATLNREMHLSYSQGANSIALRMPYAEMYVSTTRPREAMAVMLGKLKDIQTGQMDDEWLERIKNSYITASYINDQSASAITNSLGEAEILGGWQYAEDLPKLVMMATTDQVNRALQSYILGIRWYYLGNTDTIEGFRPPVY